MSFDTCEHEWQEMHEESPLGGSYKVGFQCKRCNRFFSCVEVPLSGLPGKDTGEKVLVGPHGGKSKTSTGQIYSKQILYPDGRLEIIP